MSATLLATHRVEKPWGRHRLWSGFADQEASKPPIGEIWFQTPGDSQPDLLIKYIFTNEKLSVQVHPDDTQAAARGLPRGKDECWLILAAEPDATIALGTLKPQSTETLRAAAKDGSIESLLDWKKVEAGDFFYLPARTIHAIGAGITLVEVQQNSDTTYRLYDYGRPRELHLDEGLAVANTARYSPILPPHAEPDAREILVEGPKFTVERWHGGNRSLHLGPSQTVWLLAVRGNANVDGVALATGACLTLQGDVSISAADGCEMIAAYAGSKRIDMAGE